MSLKSELIQRKATLTCLKTGANWLVLPVRMISDSEHT